MVDGARTVRHRRRVRVVRPRGQERLFSSRATSSPSAPPTPATLVVGRKQRPERRGGERRRRPLALDGAPTPTRATASRKWTRSAASWAASCCGASWAQGRVPAPSASDGKARERAELLVVEIGVGVLVDAPESAELLVEFADGCYDALMLDKRLPRPCVPLSPVVHVCVDSASYTRAHDEAERSGALMFQGADGSGIDGGSAKP